MTGETIPGLQRITSSASKTRVNALAVPRCAPETEIPGLLNRLAVQTDVETHDFVFLAHAQRHVIISTRPVAPIIQAVSAPSILELCAKAGDVTTSIGRQRSKALSSLQFDVLVF